jgi:adenine-specific DNA-methyltransferase
LIATATITQIDTSLPHFQVKQTGERGARKKTSNKWFETQDSISYSDDFNRQKIAYMEIMTDNPESGYDFPCFSFDAENCVVLNTAYIMAGDTDELKYILGILNSKLGRLLVKNYVTQLQQRQFRMLNQYVVNFPIPKSKDVKPISALVDQIITNKMQTENIKELEEKINILVYQLFNFTAKEITFIDSQ